MAPSSGGKSHRKKKAGKKAEKRKNAEQKKKGVLEEAQAAKARNNPRAFTFQSAGKAKAQRARSAEKEQRRLHAPMMERIVDEPPPFVVLVQGPPQVGKSTLIQGLVKHYTKQNLAEVKGPITVVAGKKRRVTFVECPPDLNGMLDAAKYADLVLLLVDGSFGFEMETFEFLNLLQVHGFPKVMGVLTHLDSFQDQKALKKTKKKLKARFWTEIYDGAKLFYLSGIQHGKYLKREVLNLARFISVMKMRPLTWRLNHPYVLADRFEDITPRETVRQTPKCDRDVVLYGYLRGCNIKQGSRVHLAGVGDYTIQELDPLPDPCPLPDSEKKLRTLNQRDKLLYAPMSDVGGLLYDKDAVYIDIPDWKVQYSKADGTAAAAGGAGGDVGVGGTEGDAMVRGLQGTQMAVDEKLAQSKIRMFPGGKLLAGDESTEDDEDDEGSDMDDDASEDMEGSDLSSDGEEDDDDADDDEAAAGGGKAAALKRGMPRAGAVTAADGRTRRRAFFGDDAVDVEPRSDDDEEDADEDGDDEEAGGKLGSGYKLGGQAGDEDEEGEDDDEDEEEDSEDDSEGLGAAARWKHGMQARMQSLFMKRGADLSDFVYGQGGDGEAEAGALNSEDEDEEGGAGEEDEDFFTLKAKSSEVAQANNLKAVDALDSSRVLLAPSSLTCWEEEEEVEGLRNRFVTGDWAEGEKRSGAKPQDGDEASGSGGEEGDEEVFGDFEDMETGQRFTGGDDVTAAAQKAIDEARAEEIRQKKAAKKAAFDAEYDGDDGDDKEEGEGGKGKGKGGKGRGPAGEQQEETFYDSVKRDMAARQATTKAALDALDPSTRMAMEGLRPGVYVRMRFKGLPYELVQYHDPRNPLLIGGLGQNEEKLGMMKLRFKRHRWFPKLLKARDPLVFSVGWRRFQSLPMYAVEDHNRRLRMLKYTPEHMHCMAAVYGPLAPQGTGVVAIQNLSEDVRGWRVSATGVVLELDADLRVVKKLKLVGNPFQISRHTAFVSGMFNSQLEAAKFEGASIRTVSGIRGTIKKAQKPGGQIKAKEGTFRATFEDKILMSDIVFLRAWISVDLPRFYNPVTNLLSQQAAPVQRLPKIKEKKGRRAREEREKAEAEAQQKQEEQQQPTTAALLGSAVGLGPGSLAEAAAAAAAAGAAAAQDTGFVASSKFVGAKPGFAFKKGPQGLGYYKDAGPGAAAAAASAAAAAARVAAAAAIATGSSAAAAAAAGGGGGPGTLLMRTTAQLRREVGVGAPREVDSLYKDIERAPRQFNPLHVPKALQAALPFSSKPKIEAARKGGRKTLEQKRAVVLEGSERKAYTLVQQLNALRNDKAKKRREQQDRKKGAKEKKAAQESAWRDKLNKDRRKERYREQGKAEKRKATGAAGPGGGGGGKRARRD